MQPGSKMKEFLRILNVIRGELFILALMVAWGISWIFAGPGAR
jgi:hypothetical protein